MSKTLEELAQQWADERVLETQKQIIQRMLNAKVPGEQIALYLNLAAETVEELAALQTV